jgi:hypothetical protein
VKPANREVDRIDRRLAEHQTGKRQAVVTICRHCGRTRAFVTRSEGEGAKLLAITRPQSRVNADEASSSDSVYAAFPIEHVNRREAYSWDGACTNQAESPACAAPKSERHHIAEPYIGAYTTEKLGARITAASATASNS